MPYVPVRIQPGMLLNTTEYDAKGRWVGGNWVRFWRQKVRPIGGWESAVTSLGPVVLEGVARSMHTWSDLEELNHVAIGTNLALYNFDGSNLDDISPVTDPVPPGDVSGGTGSGFGGADFGEDEYGTARPFVSLTIAPAIWTMDNWGSELVACANWDGNIYKWAPGDIEATLIEALTGTEVPQLNRAIMVSNERHLIAIGAGEYVVDHWEKNQRRIAWSSQENYAEWTPTVINSAGDLELQTPGLAICGVEFRSEILIFTDVDVHRMNYLGPPYFYGISKLADNAGIVSAVAMCVTNRFVMWVARDSFMIYDGTVKELSSEVSEWFRDRVNPQHTGKIIVGHNPRFNEVWVHLPGRDSDENSEYIIWNYEENTWSTGFLARTAWDEAQVFFYPMACEPIGTLEAPQTKLYYHERGYTNDGLSRNADIWIETSPIEIASGDQLVVCRRFIQDTASNSVTPSTALSVQFTHSLAPEASEVVEGPYAVDEARGYTDVRFTGRQVKIRWNQLVDENWSIGDYRLEIVAGSGR
jgi:hypothetical protein